MPYPQYPTAPVIPNPYQIAGQAAGQLGTVVSDFEDRQAKLRQQIQEMADKRAAAILATRKAEDEQRAADLKYKNDKDEADRALEMRKFAAGEDISPTLAANRALSQPSPKPAPMPTRQDLSALEADAPPMLPEQNIGAGSSWNDINAATDASIAAEPPPRRERTTEELIRKGLATGQMKDVGEFATAMKTAGISGQPKQEKASQVARMVRDEMMLRARQGLPITREDIRDIALKNDPDGAFVGTKEYQSLITSSSPQAALQNADNAVKRLNQQGEQFGVTTNLKLKEALDNDPFIKPYAAVARKYDQTVGVYNKYLQTHNPAFVDRTLVVNFNKLIDETSAVMGGEVDATVKEMGLTDRVFGKFGRILDGGAGFTDDERSQIMDVMKVLHDELRTKASHSYYTAKGQALDLGADPTIVTGVYSDLFEPGKSRYNEDYRGGGGHRAPSHAGPGPAPAPAKGVKPNAANDPLGIR